MARIKNSPECQTARRWLQAQEGRSCFAAFTGQDSDAFSVFIHAVGLYLRSDGTGREGAVWAMRGAVMAMQPKLREMCRQVIPAVGDWGHQEEIWPQITSWLGPQDSFAQRTHSSVNVLFDAVVKDHNK